MAPAQSRLQRVAGAVFRTVANPGLAVRRLDARRGSDWVVQTGGRDLPTPGGSYSTFPNLAVLNPRAKYGAQNRYHAREIARRLFDLEPRLNKVEIAEANWDLHGLPQIREIHYRTVDGEIVKANCDTGKVEGQSDYHMVSLGQRNGGDDGLTGWVFLPRTTDEFAATDAYKALRLHPEFD